MKHLQNGNSMKASEFSKILKTFDENQINTVEDLRKLTKIYPYFHTANFLYVKTLQNKNNLKFELSKIPAIPTTLFAGNP